MNDDRLYLPAEWAVQSGVQLTWPHAGTDWAPYLDEITETYLQLADAITSHEALLVVSPEVEHVRSLLEARLGRARMARVAFACCDTDDTWARDHGAITLMGGDEPVLLDFRFNGWGEKFSWQHDNAITRHSVSRACSTAAAKTMTTWCSRAVASRATAGAPCLLPASVCWLPTATSPSPARR